MGARRMCKVSLATLPLLVGVGERRPHIPAWTGESPRAEPIDWKVGYRDPFADDKPLFTITAANAERTRTS